MSQLSLQKKRTMENFIKEKLSKKAPRYQEEVMRTLNKLDEYSQKEHGKTREEIIQYLSDLTGEKREDETIGWVQGCLDHISEQGPGISHKVYQVYIAHIKKFLKYFKIRIDFKDEIELPMKNKEEPYPISLEEIQAIMRRAPKKCGYYQCLISSGARPVEIMALRKKDFTWTGKRWRAVIPAKYTKKKMSRTVFFSLEATPHLNKLLKNITENQRPFPKNPNCPDEKLEDARNNEGILLAKYTHDIGFTKKYETTGRNKINLYCFRAYFFTKALDGLSNDTAHAMIGHGAYLTQYQRRNDEEKEELYEEIEPSLLIFDQTRNKEKIKRLKEANKKLEENDKRVDSLEAIVLKISKQHQSPVTPENDKLLEDFIIQNKEKLEKLLSKV